MITKNMRQIDAGQFTDFVRDKRCTEHCGLERTVYLETGTRRLIAVFEQAGGKCFVVDRHKVIPFPIAQKQAA